MASSSRTMAKVTINFGLVSLPVKVHTGSDPKETHFHQVHPDDSGRIMQRRFCKVCGDEIPFAELGKCIETADGEVIVITDEQLETLPLASTREVAVTQFTSADSIGPGMYQKSYNLEPDGQGSVRAYALLHAAIREAGVVGICKVALRKRESLAALRADGPILALSLLLWPEEIRTAEFDLLDGAGERVTPAELKMATKLVEHLTRPFDPSEYVDDYGKAMAALVESVTLGKPLAVREKPEAAPEMDLEALLKASVEAAVPVNPKPAKAVSSVKASRKKAS